MPSTGSTAITEAPSVDQPAGELAGAGREVADHGARHQAEHRREDRDGLVRIAGAGQLVGGGAGLEPAGGDVIDVHGPPPAGPRVAPRQPPSVKTPSSYGKARCGAFARFHTISLRRK